MRTQQACSNLQLCPQSAEPSKAMTVYPLDAVLLPKGIRKETGGFWGASSRALMTSMIPLCETKSFSPCGCKTHEGTENTNDLIESVVSLVRDTTLPNKNYIIDVNSLWEQRVPIRCRISQRWFYCSMDLPSDVRYTLYVPHRWNVLILIASRFSCFVRHSLW